MPKKRPINWKIPVTLGVILLGAAAFIGIDSFQERYAAMRLGAASKSFDGFDPDNKLSRPTKVSGRISAGERRKEYDECFARFLERNPRLVPDWKSVPDERNGFLQWLDFSDAHRRGYNWSLELSEMTLAMISGREPWDHDYMAAEMSEQRELLAEIARIALLPEQSTSGIPIDRYSFIGARLAKEASDLLLADARLAAEDGDMDRALLRVRAVMGISRHFSGVETPSLLSETVSMLMRLNAEKQVTAHMLPALALKPDNLAEWRDVLQQGDCSPDSLARLVRGEAYVSIYGFLIPQIDAARSEKNQSIPDEDALLDAVATNLLAISDVIGRLGMADLWEGKWDYEKHVPSGLSPAAAEIYDVMLIGAPAWMRGTARTASTLTYTEAAFAIMTGAQPPNEPITGLPFVFEPVARTLSYPDDERLAEISMEPITIP